MIKIKARYRFKVDFISALVAVCLILWGVNSLYNDIYKAKESDENYIAAANIKYSTVWEKDSNLNSYLTEPYALEKLQWNAVSSIRGIDTRDMDKHSTVLIRIDLNNNKVYNPALYLQTIKGKDFQVYFNGTQVYSDTVNSLGIDDNLDSTRRNVIIPLGVPELSQNKNTVVFKIDIGKNKFVGPDCKSGSIDNMILLAGHNEVLGKVFNESLKKIITNSIIAAAALILLIVSIFFKDKDKRTLMALSVFLLLMAFYGIADAEEINLIVFNSPIIWSYILYISVAIAPVVFVYFFQQIFEEDYKFILCRLQQILMIAGVLFVLSAAVSTVTSGRIYLIGISSDIYYGLVFVSSGILIILSFVYSIRGNSEAIIFTMGLLVYTIYLGISIFKRFNMNELGLLVFMISLIILIARRFINMAQNIKESSREVETKNRELQDMWQEINKSKDEISQLNITLEERVELRTRELEKSNGELKDTLNKLKDTQEQLIQSEKLGALGGLVAGVSHEINTPVGVSVTAASHLHEKTREVNELYKNNSLKRSELNKYLNTTSETMEVILSNLQRASELIRSFKQVAVDQSSETKRIFKINEYIGQVLLSLKPKLKKTNINIGINCSEDLEIESYPGAFSQVITNLVMNSLIHGFEEGKDGTIIFDVEKMSNSIIFTYSDSGKGIEKGVLSKIFDPFFTTKRGNGGTGLGLNIVYNIVTTTLKGTITCESEIGVGTVFKIIFPI